MGSGRVFASSVDSPRKGKKNKKEKKKKKSNALSTPSAKGSRGASAPAVMEAAIHGCDQRSPVVEFNHPRLEEAATGGRAPFGARSFGARSWGGALTEQAAQLGKDLRVA